MGVEDLNFLQMLNTTDFTLQSTDEVAAILAELRRFFEDPNIRARFGIITALIGM